MLKTLLLDILRAAVLFAVLFGPFLIPALLGGPK